MLSITPKAEESGKLTECALAHGLPCSVACYGGLGQDPKWLLGAGPGCSRLPLLFAVGLGRDGLFASSLQERLVMG